MSTGEGSRSADAPRLPPGTKSERVIYYDHSTPPKKKAVIHRYRKPDNTLGASGEPDPKWLYWQGTIYGVKSKPKKARRFSRRRKRSRRARRWRG